LIIVTKKEGGREGGRDEESEKHSKDIHSIHGGERGREEGRKERRDVPEGCFIFLYSTTIPDTSTKDRLTKRARNTRKGSI